VNRGVQSCAVGLVRVAVIVVIVVDAVLHSVRVRIRESFILGEVAVIVRTVTQFFGSREDERIQRRAVASVRHPVAVRVIFARVSHLVAVCVVLVLVGDQRAVVTVVHVTVAILVVIARVPIALPVDIPLEGVENLGTVVQSIGDGVTVYVLVHAIHDPVLVGIGISLVHFLVAVVILTVAFLLGPRVDLLVKGGAVVLVRDLIVVIIQVARIPQGVQVVVLLLGVENGGTVVYAIGAAVSVLVGLEAVSRTVVVRIRVSLVHIPIAVVVFAIAGFGHGLLAITGHRTGNTALEPGTASKLICNQAVCTGHAFVGLAAAVVVEVVAYFLCRYGRAAWGEALRQALSGPFAKSPFVLNMARG